MIGLYPAEERQLTEGGVVIYPPGAKEPLLIFPPWLTDIALAKGKEEEADKRREDGRK